MNAIRWLGMITLILSAALLVGCGGGETSQSAASVEKGKQGAEVKANLARLGAQDEPVAEAQKVCPVTGEELGGMGVPVKVTVKDQSVFLCCKSCQKKALAEPDKTLAKVKELKGN